MAVSMKSTIVVEKDGEAALALLEASMRTKVVVKALRLQANVVRDRAKQLAPVGKTGNLKKTIKTRLRSYDTVDLAVVGPEWPEGAHGHLVEFGHEIVSHGVRTGKRTEPKPFLRPAVLETEAEQKAVFTRTIKKGTEAIVK